MIEVSLSVSGRTGFRCMLGLRWEWWHSLATIPSPFACLQRNGLGWLAKKLFPAWMLSTG